MVTMASSFDAHLEDSRSCVSCKDVGSLRYHMGSALIAMVEVFHALHSLWVSLFPFVMLWWNLLLCATCAKYFSWNRSRLRLPPIAGRRRSYGDIMQDTGLFAEELNAEESHIFSASCADDAWHAEKRQMSIPSFDQRGSCDLHSGVSIHVFPLKEERQRGSSRQEYPLVGVFIQAFPQQRGLRKCIDAATPCTDEWGPHHLNQMEELDASESTSIDSPAEATRSYISKLPSLSFLDGRGLQLSGSLRPSHWAACASLVLHQVPLLDSQHCSRSPVEYSLLQLSLRRNGDMSHIKVINAILGEWLQICDECSVSCVPAQIRGNEYPDLACHFIQFLASGTTNVDYTTFQPVLPTTNITNTVSLSVAFKGAMEDVESRIRDRQSSSIFHCDVGEDVPHCVEDAGGIYGRPDGDADDGFYDGDSDFDDNGVDDGDSFSDFDFADDNGPIGDSFQMMQLQVAHTWWDEDALLVDEQEGDEEDSMEQAWQVV